MSTDTPSSAGRGRGAAWLLHDLPVGIASALVLVMLLVGNANTVWRWLTGEQINGSGELLVVLLPITVFLALPAAERAGANVRSTALTDRLPDGLARVVTAIGMLVNVGMAAFLFVASVAKASDTTAEREALVGVRTLPVWPSRIAIAVGLGLLALVLLGQLARRGADEPDGGSEDGARL